VTLVKIHSRTHTQLKPQESSTYDKSLETLLAYQQKLPRGEVLISGSTKLVPLPD